jgi:hypothetical protein
MISLKTSRPCLFIIAILTFYGCSGGKGDTKNANSSITSAAAISASQVETAKLQMVLETESVYKIEDSELFLLKPKKLSSRRSNNDKFR